MTRTLRTASIAAAACMSLIILGATAQATVVNFDDLTGLGIVPDGYGGITWNGNWTYNQFVSPPYNSVSPPNAVYDFVHAAPLDFPAPVVFHGAYFSGLASSVSFSLYNGATLVWTSASLAPSSTPAFLASGYSGLVTEVIVNSPNPTLFVMDNVTYNPSTAVPEPASLSLLGIALAGMGWARRRKTA